MSGSVSEYSFMKRNVPNVQCLSQKQPINFPTYFQEQNIHLEVHLLSIPSYQLKSKEVFFFLYLFIHLALPGYSRGQGSNSGPLY